MKLNVDIYTTQGDLSYSNPLTRLVDVNSVYCKTNFISKDFVVVFYFLAHLELCSTSANMPWPVVHCPPVCLSVVSFSHFLQLQNHKLDWAET